jgi:hypothetical protein
MKIKYDSIFLPLTCNMQQIRGKFYCNKQKAKLWGFFRTFFSRKATILYKTAKQKLGNWQSFTFY